MAFHASSSEHTFSRVKKCAESDGAGSLFLQGHLDLQKCQKWPKFHYFYVFRHLSLFNSVHFGVSGVKNCAEFIGKKI